jgi:RNA polymerase sigma-70 factor (ECF subfamily)
MTELLPDAATASVDVRLAVDGDTAAFTRLVAAYHADLARVVYAIAGDPVLTEEAVQAAWAKAWRKLASVRDPGRLRPWLLAIAVNEARQIVRRDRRVSVVELDPRDPGPAQADPAVGIGRLDLRRALDRLAPDDRALIALRYVAGFDATEIGAMTGRSASGTRTRLSRLTARLREELGR